MLKSRVRGVIRRWGGCALVAAFAVVVLGPALVGHGVLIDTDLLAQRPPWGTHHATSAILCRSDPIDFYLPGIKNIRAALWDGHLATWAPYEVGGTPLAALPNHGWLDPLSWPYLVLPLWLAPAFVKLAELVTVVVGMAGFLARLGVRRSAGLVAGLLFFASGFMVMWTGWPQTRVAAWIPMLFWALDLVATRRAARDVAALAVVVACMLLGGFPAVTLFALTAGAVYVLVRASTGSAAGWARGCVLALGGVVLGAGLAAVQLLPFVKDLGEIGLAERSPGPHPPLGMLATSVAPNVFGTCIGGAKFGPVNPIDGTAFLGIAALVLVVCAVVVPGGFEARSARTSTNVLVGILAGSVVLIWIGGPALSLLQRLPGYDSNNIGRADSVFGFAGAALAGIGLERLLGRGRARWTARRSVAGAGAVLLLLVAFAWVFRDARRETTDRAFFDHSLWLPLAVGVVAVAGLVVALRFRRIGVTVIVAAALTQSAWFAHQQLPTSPRSSFYPTTDVQRFLQQHLGHDRWAPSGKVALAATTDWYHLRTPLGHEFTQPEWKALLEQVAPGTMKTATYSQFPPTLTLAQVAASHALDELSVRYWVTGPGEHSPGPTMPVVLSSQDATIFERTTALPRIRWENNSGATAGVGRDDPGHIALEVDAADAGRVVVADAIVRDGWTATVDGQAAAITRTSAFGAVQVPAGKHRVVLTYRAPGLRAGAVVSALSLLLTVGLLTASRISRRRRRPLDSRP